MDPNLSSRLGAHGLSRQQFLTALNQLLGERPAPDDVDPPGPWDPVLARVANRLVSRAASLAGKHPAEDDPNFPPRPPWLLGLFETSPVAEVALNPQPLPPEPPGYLFSAALADELVRGTARAQELAEAVAFGREQPAEAGPGARLLAQVDELCGNDVRFGRPGPGPRPPGWKTQLSGADLVVMGLVFEHAARRVHSAPLQRAYAGAGAKLVDAGWQRLA